MEEYNNNLLKRQMVYLANELVKAAWNPEQPSWPERLMVTGNRAGAWPDGIGERPGDYLPLMLHLEEGTPSGGLIPLLVETLYGEYLKRTRGKTRTTEFCQHKLPDLIKEYFPYLMTQTSAIKRLQKICREMNLEFSNVSDAPLIHGLGSGLGGVLEQDPEGRSPVWRELLSQVARAAWSAAPILLTGESGTGKEVVARFIHDRSPRAKGPFIPLNCGAVPENLLESELFGYRKGAFSEAKQDKEGLFAAAHQGTLFLDEISEMPGHLQVKLLRFTQEHTVLPLGAVKELRVDTRIVAATNRDLGGELERGTFRTDLYYRLNVFRFTIPPLRHRTEDISWLSWHFVRLYNQANEAHITGISPEVMEVFDKYAWPGNVRELENVIHRAVVLARDGDIGLEHLPEELAAQNRGGSGFLKNVPDQRVLIKDITRALSLSERDDGPPRRLGASLSVQYLADFFSSVRDGFFRPGDFAEYLSVPAGMRRRDKLSNQIISALLRAGILDHNGRKAQASRYRLSIKYSKLLYYIESE
jgi:DNA-binding NtrC family response regulator